MRKKNLWTVGIFIVVLVVFVGTVRYSEIQKRESDPNWRIAQEIYKVENVLKEVDEDYEYQSVSKVTPFTYTDSEGNTIVYLQVSYLY